MLYYVIHENTNIQLFDAKWTSTKSIIADLDKIKSILNNLDINELIICGGKCRFTLQYCHNEIVELVFNGKHFYADARYGYSYVMPKNPDDLLIDVYNNEQLNNLLGEDING